nr:L,D-transpeptidase [Allopseudospirillum japonicum]
MLDDILNPVTPLVAQIPNHWLYINIRYQCLAYMQGIRIESAYPMSSARLGVGERQGSGCTPRGWHKIRACIGENLPAHAVLVGRRWTGELYTPELALQFPKRDWILGRILWLSGLEVGKNRGGQCDTMRRYIYIHGTPDDQPMGVPRSHGCIRMHVADMLDLYARVSPLMQVFIDAADKPLRNP